MFIETLDLLCYHLCPNAANQNTHELFLKKNRYGTGSPNTNLSRFLGRKTHAPVIFLPKPLSTSKMLFTISMVICMIQIRKHTKTEYRSNFEIILVAISLIGQCDNVRLAASYTFIFFVIVLSNIIIHEYEIINYN